MDDKTYNSEHVKKVLKGLECHSVPGECGPECPYEAPGTCSEPLCADALAIIRAQAERIRELEAEKAPRVMTLEELKETETARPVWIEKPENGCDFGQWGIAKFNRLIFAEEGVQENYRDMGGEYGKVFRCWTARPTDEQREAVKWE